MICCRICRAQLDLKQWIHHKCVKYTGGLAHMVRKKTTQRVSHKRKTWIS